MKKYIFLVVTVLLTSTSGFAQDDSEELFSVAGEPVTVGEFRYIYSKTNGEEASFSQESLEEYLDLYERFKLKVARARDMGLDTVTALQDELAGYRRQLADNYLLDRQVTDKLVEELHTRQKLDVDFSHILIKFPGSEANPDTAGLYERAAKIRAELTADNFAERAKNLSQDQYSKDKGGRIGYATAPFPSGLHALEAAIYGAKDGEIVGPVRTGAGYHLVLRHGSRPARGEVEIAHILIRKGEGIDPAGARERAEQAIAALEAGKNFEAVAREYSEDDKTKNEGGYIGFFGINRYSPLFEDAAFALSEDGEVSQIVESPVGFHILRRISHRGVQPLRDVRPLLESRVKSDRRFTEAKQAMIVDLKDKLDVTEDVRQFGMFSGALDSTFFEPQWKGTQVTKGSGGLLSIGDRQLSLNDFNDYLEQNVRQRISLRRNGNATAAAKDMYQNWVDEQVLAVAEARLEKDFPEFRALMREYREGILLFEATKLEVWDRAGTDSTGLQEFFAEHRDEYAYQQRARVTGYVIDLSGDVQPEEVAKLAATTNADAVADRVGRQYVDVTEETYEADRLPEGLEMKVGSSTEPRKDLRKGNATFYRVEEIMPARPKELNEARGYVIADYQDELERQWVAELRKTYPVKLNKRVFAKLVKS